MKDELLEAYGATLYTVEDGPTLRVGQSCSRLDELLHAHEADTAAYLTAYNPYSRYSSIEFNAEANEQLLNELKSLTDETVILRGKGVDPSGNWSGEESFLVVGISLQTAMQLAERYGQNAFVFHEKGNPSQLILTSHMDKDTA